MKNFVFIVPFCALVSGCTLLSQPKDIKTLTGDEKINECIKLHNQIRSLESHLLSIENCYANPSTVNYCIEASSRLERDAAYFNKACAGQD